MKGEQFAQALNTITSLNHPKIHPVKEIYADSHAIYLISNSLSGSYKNLMDFGVLEESELT